MTTKTKVQPKKGSNSEPKKNPAARIKTADKKKPTEEQIRLKAQEIYYQRLTRGEYGTELEDWQTAEKILSES